MDHEKYQISIERDGRMVPVGSISGESYRTAIFSYIVEYLGDRNAVPVSISLHPAYDMVSTTVYESSTREMAFAIGSTLSIEDITENSFIEASEEVHLGKRFAVGRYHYICNHFREVLRDSVAELSEAGFSNAKEMEYRILRTVGYAKL